MPANKTAMPPPKADYGPTDKKLGRDGRLHELEDMDRHDKAAHTKATGESHHLTKVLAGRGSKLVQSITRGSGAINKSQADALAWLFERWDKASSAGLKAIDMSDDTVGGGTIAPQEIAQSAVSELRAAMRHVGKGNAHTALLWALTYPDRSIHHLADEMGQEWVNRSGQRAFAIAWLAAGLDAVQKWREGV